MKSLAHWIDGTCGRFVRISRIWQRIVRELESEVVKSSDMKDGKELWKTITIL